MSRLTTGLGLIALAGLVLLGAPAARAANNQATGDIAGNASDLSSSNIFSLNSATLALVKRAFLADGTPLASGSSIPKGTVVKFVIYVNNNTAIPVTDLSVRDVLDPAFAYQAGTLKVDNSVANCAAAACTALEESTIYTAVNGAAAKTDAVDADVVSYNAGTKTVDAGNQSVANGQLDVAASKVWAVIFTVVMQ